MCVAYCYIPYKEWLREFRGSITPKIGDKVLYPTFIVRANESLYGEPISKTDIDVFEEFKAKGKEDTWLSRYVVRENVLVETSLCNASRRYLVIQPEIKVGDKSISYINLTLENVHSLVNELQDCRLELETLKDKYDNGKDNYNYLNMNYELVCSRYSKEKYHRRQLQRKLMPTKSINFYKPFKRSETLRKTK